MQHLLDLGPRRELTEIFGQLRRIFPEAADFRVLDPVGQLVKSIISSRTRDDTSWSAFCNLVRRFPDWAAMADASIVDIEIQIAEVTRFKDRAADVQRTLRMLRRERPDFDLGFLGAMPPEQAQAWLQRFPGVGPKVAAAVLNFSTLRGYAFVVDLHVLRVLRRLGFIGQRATIDRTRLFVLDALSDWPPQRLAELHVVLKKLGQNWCRHGEPECDGCPLAARCPKLP